jgi:hypothetical protein
MTPDRTWDPLRFQRGTRGFAAFVTALSGFTVLGVATLVAPSAGLAEPLVSWTVILGVAAGIAHLVAAVGLIRARSWGRDLVLYLAGIGIGVSVFSVLLIARAGESILGAGDATTVGFFAWMIGSWLVAARFAYKAFAAPTTRRMPRTTRLTLPTPRIVAPTIPTTRPAFRQGTLTPA